jgi:hypothetical protein
MAIQIPEPRINAATLDDWSAFVARTTQQGGGFMCIALSSMNDSGAPAVLAGSRIEINGAFYKCTANEGIGGTAAANAVNYIYAVPSGASCSFAYSPAAPSFDPAKGGWYSGNNRAIAKLFFTGNQFNGKVILDSYDAMSKVNTEQPIPTSGGSHIADGGIDSITAVWLSTGAYRVELKGGNGGKGGGGGNDGQATYSAPGGAGVAGETITPRTFRITVAIPAYLLTGADGGDGGDGDSYSGSGGFGGGGGGGGGGSGEGSAFLCGTKSLIARGGSGGGGGGGQGLEEGRGGGGGGGGAGEGVGGAGTSVSGTRNGSGGTGGNNGQGGNGGTPSSLAGGSIIPGGGGGGSNNGSGAGEAAQKGGNGTSTSSGKGGGTKGGSAAPSAQFSMVNTGWVPDFIVSPTSMGSYAGGGGGGAGGNKGYGGNGGGLKSTSSGYARLYKLW